MNILDPVVAPRIIFILGMLNLVTGTLVLFSCRCLPGSKIGANLMQRQAYKRFYRYHCYIWLVFWTSVVIHVSLAVTFLGWPF